jgi:hypothetical protein
MNQKFYLILIVLFLSGFILAACGKTTPSHPVAADAPPSVQAVAQASSAMPALPLGSYRTVLKANNFHPGFGVDAPKLQNYLGLWELKLAEQDRFSLALNNRAVAEGAYQLSSDQIYFNSAAGWPSICGDDQEGDSATAVYGWQLKGASLDLSGKDKPCSVKGLVFSHLLELSGR